MFDLYRAQRRKRKLMAEYVQAVRRLQARGASREELLAHEASHNQAIRVVDKHIAILADNNQSAWARRSFKVIALRVIYVVLGLYAIFLIYGYFRAAPKSKIVTISMYSENICDDQEKTEDHSHENENPDKFSVPLHEGCFSGFVEMPHVWQQWRAEFLGPRDESEWVSQWWVGTKHPMPIQTYAILTAAPGNFIVSSYEVRLQGKGTLVFYRVAEWPNRPNSTGKAGAPVAIK